MFTIKVLHQVSFPTDCEVAKLKARVHYLENVIETALLLTQNLKKMDIEIERLETEVSENTSATDSAIQLLSTLAQTIRDNAGNKAKMLELAGKLDANSNRLAEAVMANTIETPPQPTEPVEPVEPGTPVEPVTPTDPTGPTEPVNPVEGPVEGGEVSPTGRTRP